jgi:hypothetical protein
MPTAPSVWALLVLLLVVVLGQSYPWEHFHFPRLQLLPVVDLQRRQSTERFVQYQVGNCFHRYCNCFHRCCCCCNRGRRVHHYRRCCCCYNRRGHGHHVQRLALGRRVLLDHRLRPDSLLHHHHRLHKNHTAAAVVAAADRPFEHHPVLADSTEAFHQVHASYWVACWAYRDTFDAADTCLVRAFAVVACTGPDGSRDAERLVLVVVTDAWAFVVHHSSFLAAACRIAFAFVAVVASDIVVAVAAVVPVELQIVATTNLRPPRPVAAALPNLPPKWMLLLVRLLRSSSRKQAVVVVPAVVACDVVVAFAVPFLRIPDTDLPDTVDSSCASFLARERKSKSKKQITMRFRPQVEPTTHIPISITYLVVPFPVAGNVEGAVNVAWDFLPPLPDRHPVVRVVELQTSVVSTLWP